MTLMVAPNTTLFLQTTDSCVGGGGMETPFDLREFLRYSNIMNSNKTKSMLERGPLGTNSTQRKT